MHSISNAFYLECILTRNERSGEKGFSGIDSHLRGDRDKSTSSVISLNMCVLPRSYIVRVLTGLSLWQAGKLSNLPEYLSGRRVC
jgi:hypothetical protein